MSRIPSNTEQFLGGLAASQNFLQQAGANQQAKMNYQLAQQQMGLERDKMAQQGQQFQQGLQAEAENYRKLNESRERMAQAEMQQQGSQFSQKMAFDKEQGNLERLIGLKMKQLDMDMARNEQEIAAMADDDPRLVEAKNRRKKLRSDARNLEQMMGSSQVAMQLAQGVKADRLDEVDARLGAFKDALSTRKTKAEQALKNGLDYAVLNDARQGGFIKEVARLVATGVPHMQGMDTTSAALNIMADNLVAWGLGTGDPRYAEAKATEFQKNGAAMAVQIVKNSIELNKDAFGLEPGKQAEAAQVAADMVAKAAILANVDPRVRAGGGAAQADLRAKIAKGFGDLRKAGMGDEQISALLEGLESIGENRGELLRVYTEKDPNVNQENILDRSLKGVGKIQDVLDGVANDQKVMESVGGRLVDHSKYDWVGVTRKARMAYGMGQSSELQQLMRDMQSMGMTQGELKQMSQLLIESDPNLRFLRPEEFAQMLRGMSLTQGDIGAELESVGEDIGRVQGQVVARGRLKGLSQAEQQLADIAGLVGG